MNSFVFPGNLDPVIARMGADPIPYMRTDSFSRINKESEQMLLDFIHCKEGKTIIYTGSGTGAMSAVVENYASTKRKALVIDGGSFGHRWFQLCEYYGVPVVDYVVPFAEDIDYSNLETRIEIERPDILLCQHHETSSGQLFNLAEISRICQRFNISLVVDVISSFLAEELDMDALGIDICVTSTQKGLNIPPGLSIIFLSKRLKDYPFNHNGYYWDFETNLSNLERGQTPFSPATTIYLQLHARLKQLMAEGGEHNNIELVRQRAQCFRKLCKEYGWGVPAQTPSYAITGFKTRDSAERIIFKGLAEKYDTFIMPGGKPGFYRVSHMGLQTEEDLKTLASQIYELESSCR